MNIGEFFAQYWVTFLFGLIAAFVTLAVKLYYSTKDKEHARKIDELKETLVEEREAMKDELITLLHETVKIEENKVIEEDEKIIQDMDQLSKSVLALTQGLLSVQGKTFKGDCRRLLEHSHVITEEEYEDIVADHKAYNGLGGNHMGDSLFKSVMNKWNAQIELGLEDAMEEKDNNG